MKYCDTSLTRYFLTPLVLSEIALLAGFVSLKKGLTLKLNKVFLFLFLTFDHKKKLKLLVFFTKQNI